MEQTKFYNPKIKYFNINHHSSVCLKWLSLSGCELLTGSSLRYLEKFSSTLEHIDLSGCFRLVWMQDMKVIVNKLYYFRMTGSSIKAFTNQCQNLNLESLAYCSYIQVGTERVIALSSLLTDVIPRTALLQTSPVAVRTWTVMWDTAAQTIRISGQPYLLWLLFTPYSRNI